MEKEGGVLLVEDASVGGDDGHLPWNQLAGVGQCFFQRIFQSAAAGNLHPHQSDALDVVIFQNGGQLFGIVHRIELGTADQRNAVFDELVVEVGESKRSTVGSDEQMSAVKEGGIGCNANAAPASSWAPRKPKSPRNSHRPAASTPTTPWRCTCAA